MEDTKDVKNIKIELGAVAYTTSSQCNQFKSEPLQDSSSSDGKRTSEPETISPSHLSSQRTSVNSLISIKQEKEDEYILSDKVQEYENTMDSLDEISKKKRRLGPTASSIAAEDEDSRSCDYSETLPEHLSDFATPLMEMEVLETDDHSRSQNGPRRRRNRSKFVLNRTSKGMGKGCENCRSKCHDRITEEQRQSIFEHFWCLVDAASQWLFIDMHTKTKETERKTTNWQSNRKISRSYYFDVNGAEVKVCQVMFLSTLGVSEKWVRNLTLTLREDPESIEISPTESALPSGELESFHASLFSGSSDNCLGPVSGLGHLQERTLRPVNGVPVLNLGEHVSASSVASEEENIHTEAERMGENSDSCDSNESAAEETSDSAVPPGSEGTEERTKEADPDNASESPSSKRRDRAKPESKWKRGKVMGKGCENCRAKCQLRITDEQRASFFELFWNLGDSAKQWQFIANHTRTKDTERKTTNWHSNRKVTRSYYIDVDNEEVKVCQLMFLSTLGISEKWIKTALTKKDQDLFPDRRGKTRRPFSKLKGPVFDSITEHVDLFERCQECHEILAKECLPESLSLRKMYDLYVEFMRDKQRTLDEELKAKQKKVVLTVATERQYRDVFKKAFHLPFHPPRKGQCERCCARSTADDSKKKQDLEEHVRSKDAVREIKDSDKVEAVKHSCVCLASFDTQRIGLPCGDVPAFHYSRRLSVYHLSVFDIGKSQPYGYLWTEQTAKRGGNETASCLKDFVEQRLAFGIVDFRFYSDGCTLLKKTKSIFGLWYYLANKYSINITHRFLESGHTLTEGHAVLADIERKVRKYCLYSPDQLKTFIRDIRDTKPAIVKELEQQEVYDMDDIRSGQNWDKDTNGDLVRWSEVREVQVCGDWKGAVKFKYDFLSEYLVLEVESSESQVSRSDYVFKRAYDQKRPLSKEKIDGLISLCTKNLIPVSRHDFYYQLAAKSEESRETK